MPIPREDRHSGAIIFYPTPQELAEKETSKRVEEKEKKLDELIEEAKKFLGAMKEAEK